MVVSVLGEETARLQAINKPVAQMGTEKMDLKGPGTTTPFTNPDDLHLFYEDLVRTLRDRGVVCGITSGLACVHYGVAETTKDCDLLCHPGSFEALLRTLSETCFGGEPCRYRGHISPPLDARWHVGGWTS